MHQGHSGTRILPIGENSLRLYAIVEFGPATYASTPRVLRVLNEADARVLLDDLLTAFDLLLDDTQDGRVVPPEPSTYDPNADPPF